MSAPRLTAPQAKVLGALAASGPHTARYLTRQVLGQHSVAGACRVLYGLHSKGYVELVGADAWRITAAGMDALRRHARRRAAGAATQKGT